MVKAFGRIILIHNYLICINFRADLILHIGHLIILGILIFMQQSKTNFANFILAHSYSVVILTNFLQEMICIFVQYCLKVIIEKTKMF